MKNQLIASFIVFVIAGCGLLPPPPENGNPPPPREDGEVAPQLEQETAAVELDTPSDGFTLTSPVMQNGGQLPTRFTCDGESQSPPLAWQEAPAGTVG